MLRAILIWKLLSFLNYEKLIVFLYILEYCFYCLLSLSSLWNSYLTYVGTYSSHYFSLLFYYILYLFPVLLHFIVWVISTDLMSNLHVLSEYLLFILLSQLLKSKSDAILGVKEGKILTSFLFSEKDTSLENFPKG